MGVQECGIDVDGLSRGHASLRQVDLEIAEQVSQHVAKQNHASDGHHYFFADTGLVESDGAMQWISCRDGAHLEVATAARKNGPCGGTTLQYTPARAALS